MRGIVPPSTLISPIASNLPGSPSAHHTGTDK
jgi:hypothetical protein